MFVILYMPQGRGQLVAHSYQPKTLAEALGVGHELTRDGVADSFKVIRIG